MIIVHVSSIMADVHLKKRDGKRIKKNIYERVVPSAPTCRRMRCVPGTNI